MSIPSRAYRIVLRLLVVVGLFSGIFILFLRYQCLLGGYPGVYGGSCYKRRNYVSNDLETYTREPYNPPPHVEVVMVSTPREQAAGTTDWMSNSTFSKMTGLPKTHVEVKKYVAGDESAEYHPRFNKGHEVSTYLSYIVENYDHLPDIVLFIHAEDNAWHVEPLLLGSLSYALTRLDLDQVRARGFVNLRVGWRGGCPYGINMTGANNGKLVGQEAPYMYQAWVENFAPLDKTAYFSVPEVVAAPCCSQFAVTRETIQSKPKAQYERSLMWLKQTPLPDYISGRVWERLFQFLFAGRARDCPDERKTYCTLYKLCLDADQWKEYKAAEEEDADLRLALPSVWSVVWKLQVTRRLAHLGSTMRRLRQLALVQGQKGEMSFQILSAVAISLLLGGAASAAVVAGRQEHITVKLCPHENMDGDCWFVDVNECTNVQEHMNDMVSSFDTGERTCSFFERENCGGHSYTARGERKTLPKDFNDQISSLKCNVGP
ncbi:hypothetical protein PspLS_08032 [Pyricularia sp. CBS 133598]|nr:hypothetical protein PspLS_08032 [Pyricularia sp. CBS 133598]